MSTDANRPSLRFPAARRLKQTREFSRVRTEGRAVRGGLLLLGILEPGDEPVFRVGLVTSKRVVGAVVRNRVRRRLREIMRKHQHALRPGLWMVIVARPPAGGATAAELEAECLRLLERGRAVAA